MAGKTNLGGGSGVTAASEPVLRARGVSRSFGAVHALEEVGLDLYRGEIHAVCGENGAGKSTLMAILSGSLKADRGTMELAGRPYEPSDPAEAVAHGVAIVHQERSLLPNISVAENVCLATAHVGGTWFVKPERMRRRARALLASLDPDIDPDRPVGELSTARQQVVEIAKALCRDPRVLILDEPTSSIGSEAAARLFEILGSLRAQGLAIVYISHHLDEVFQIADRISVLRDGRGQGSWPAADLDEQRLVSTMVGREYSHAPRSTPGARTAGGPVLEVEDLSREREFDGVSLTVHSGEIVALTGLVGAGRSEVSEAIFGARRAHAGRVLLDGVPLPPGRPDVAIRRGLCMLTEDRKQGGLFMEMSIQANVAAPSLARLRRGPFVDDRGSRDLAGRYMRALSIRAPGVDVPCASLSGGNQQKVLLAMWLAREPRVLIADEPTRGVDVGAKEEIHEILLSIVAEGVGVLLVSSDQAEVARLADRSLVMRRGRIVAELDAGADEQEIIGHASGAIRAG